MSAAGAATATTSAVAAAAAGMPALESVDKLVLALVVASPSSANHQTTLSRNIELAAAAAALVRERHWQCLANADIYKRKSVSSCLPARSLTD